MDGEVPKATRPPRDEHGKLLCSYCERPAVFQASSEGLYGGTDYGPVWLCPHCQAWVGCHEGRNKPLGRLANKDLRQAKMAAHAAFDRLWLAKWRRERCHKNKARHAGYKWLASQLGIDGRVCHIGYMNAAMCRQVVEICRPYLNRRGR